MRRSKLHLVDLAGSERVSKTGVDGTTLREAKYINLSLHYLEQVLTPTLSPRPACWVVHRRPVCSPSLPNPQTEPCAVRGCTQSLQAYFTARVPLGALRIVPATSSAALRRLHSLSGGSNSSILNDATAQMNHKLAHQAAPHQHSIGAPLSNPPLSRVHTQTARGVPKGHSEPLTLLTCRRTHWLGKSRR